MSHVIANKMLKAFTDILRESIATEEFLNSLTDTELMNLVVAVEGNARDRKLVVVNPTENTLTPEAQCAALQERFGVDGNKQMCSTPVGFAELMSFDRESLPFDLVKNELGHHVIVIGESSMQTAVLLSMTNHFHLQGVHEGYRVGDLYYLYVDAEQPSAVIHFHNRTTNKIYRINTNLVTFADWFENVLTVAEKNRQDFLSK